MSRIIEILKINENKMRDYQWWNQTVRSTSKEDVRDEIGWIYYSPAAYVACR